jgi:hypothetical protein
MTQPAMAEELASFGSNCCSLRYENGLPLLPPIPGRNNGTTKK